ncbi:MAG TPA: radical SAM protein [Bryobacteraceae bacterium]|nr:radical SAM protein [Bryobacteraceae bacterium]HXR76535.1 radical SAM protein [Bryobacteraceae bacterium]
MTTLIRSLPVLVLYPHARCNCRCVMCDIWKDTSQSELAADELARHLADIEALSVKWVVFSGGEPLMHSDLFRLSDMLRSKHIRVTLLSTGLLLKRYAEQIAAGIDDVIVSLDGPPHIHDQIRRVPGAFSQLQDGIRAIHDLNPNFPISARCTIQRLNYSTPSETAEVAKRLGLRSISFLAADLTSEAFNRFRPWEVYRQAQVALTLEEVVTLERELELVSSNWEGTGFVAENAEKLRRIPHHFRVQLGLCRPQAPQCNAPWVSAVVEADGAVRPCFFHRPIGSLKSHTLLQALNGIEAQEFRASLDVATNPVCSRCVCSLNWK